MPRLMQENSVVFDHIQSRARNTVATIKEHLSDLIYQFDRKFVCCVQHLAALDGNVLFTGVGKSAYVAKKLSVTFASLGMPSFFLHPVEMGHGDLGNVTENDALIVISHSGETAELLSLMPSFKDRSGCLIALVGNEKSSIASSADYCLSIGAVNEACHLGLAPTTSTTMSLVLGDTLAICTSELRGFTRDDFAKSHPSGRLGQLLTFKVADVMIPKNACAIVSSNEDVQSSLMRMAECQHSISVIENDGEIVGLQTVALIGQAKMLNGDLTTICNSQYVIPLTIRLDSSLIVQEAMSLITDAPSRYYAVFDKDEFVGLFDSARWKQID